MYSKKVSISAIAAAAKVSPATVSRVLNHRNLVRSDTIEAVEMAMQELGYAPTERAKKNEPQKGVIILSKSRSDMFYDEITRGAKIAAEASGHYFLENFSSINSNNCDNFCDLLLRCNVSGVILMSHVDTESLKRIKSIVPVIQCCEFNRDVDCPYISVDDYSAAVNATEHLISSGRRRLALVNSPFDFKYAYERRHGFYKALSDAKITIPKYWEIQLPDNNYSLAYAAVTQILRFGDDIPDGIFATSDIMAVACLNAAKACGISVPDDLMVIGFDDIELSQMTTPTLSTVRQPRYLLGYTACNMLLQMINDPGRLVNNMTLETELIVRQSTSLR